MTEDAAAVCQSDESESARIPPCGIVFEALAVFDLLVFAFALSLCNAGMAPVAKPIK